MSFEATDIDALKSRAIHYQNEATRLYAVARMHWPSCMSSEMQEMAYLEYEAYERASMRLTAALIEEKHYYGPEVCKGRVRQMAQLMRALAQRHGRNFDMSVYFDCDSPSPDTIGCGTPMCIAGHAVVYFYGNDYPFMTAHRGATRLLGLNHEQSMRLFTMNNTHHTMETVDATSAARVLEHLAETGKVDWNRA